MTKKKSAAVEAVAPVSLNGYRRPRRYRWFSLDLGDLEEGVSPFRIRIVSNLTFDQRNAIPAGRDVTFAEVFEAIAPNIVEWNHQKENLETGQYEPVPPPSEIGMDALGTLDDLEVLWLGDVVKNSHMRKSAEEQEAHAKPSAVSAHTPDSGPDSGSE